MVDAQTRPGAVLSSRPPGEGIFSRFPWLGRWQTVAMIYVVLTLGVSIRQLIRAGYTDFSIFSQSFIHLVNGSGLYLPYPAEQSDLFKYSPTFALFMAPFWLAPKWIGAPAWNLLNAFVPFVAVNRLALSSKTKAFILLFVAVELIGSIQSSESNGLVAGLMIGSFAALERGRPMLSALLAAANLHVKLFGVVVAAMFVMYPGRKTFVVSFFILSLGLALLPVFLTGMAGLAFQYHGWLELLQHDQIANNFSLMGFVNKWFNVAIPNLWFQMAGAVVLVAPLLRQAAWSDYEWRLRFLASVLFWVIIFNHKAESPTFVIAMCGAAIWGVLEPPSLTRSISLALTFVATSLLSTDMVPQPLRQAIFRPLGIKAFPSFILFAHNLWRLLSGTVAESTASNDRDAPSREHRSTR